MPSNSPTSNPPSKGGLFRVIVAAEVVLLLGLLGIWGYRVLKQNLAAADTSDSQTQTPTPAHKETHTPMQKPARHTIASRPPQHIRTPRGINESATQTTARNSPPRSTTQDSSPLPALQSPSILIEKSKQRLTVFDNGRIVKRYPVSTGRDAGDKTREGDYRTPEGEFYVCVRNAKSKYTRALGLSYPDISDARRGLRDGLITQQNYNRITEAIRLRRQPPWNTPLGGEIMIHGDRRGGRTTQGCIALEDRDILELFPKIPIGTCVIIKP